MVDAPGHAPTAGNWEHGDGHTLTVRTPGKRVRRTPVTTRDLFQLLVSQLVPFRFGEGENVLGSLKGTNSTPPLNGRDAIIVLKHHGCPLFHDFV
jgi:hypothetical protein